MNKKTEELRDLFVSVTDEETVTERQQESRGSLAEERDSSERLGEIIARMREEYDFTTELADGELATVVEGFYDGSADSALAEQLGVSRRTVFQARLDLHLIRDRDTDAPFDLSELRNLLVEGATTGETAEQLGVSESTVRRYRRIVTAQNEARRVSDRFRSEFEDVLVDAELGEHLTTDMKDDGLEDATEGMESNVSF